MSLARLAAMWMPRSVVRWAAARMFVEATSGRFNYDYGLTMMEAMHRWDFKVKPGVKVLLKSSLFSGNLDLVGRDLIVESFPENGIVQVRILGRSFERYSVPECELVPLPLSTP